MLVGSCALASALPSVLRFDEVINTCPFTPSCLWAFCLLSPASRSSSGLRTFQCPGAECEKPGRVRSIMRTENIRESTRKNSGSYRGGCEAQGPGRLGWKCPPSLGLDLEENRWTSGCCKVGVAPETPAEGCGTSRAPGRMKTCVSVVVWQRLLCVHRTHAFALGRPGQQHLPAPV